MTTAVGLIGCGEMGTALMTKIAQDFQMAQNLYICSPSRDFNTIPWLTPSIKTTRKPEEVIQNCRVIFLAVSTAALLPLLTEHKILIAAHKPILVSMCAKGSLEEMTAALDIGEDGSRSSVLRIMPNTPCEIGAGVIGLAHKLGEFPDVIDEVIRILRSTAHVCVIKEEEFFKFTVAYSCSPAYNYMTMEAISDAAVKLGLPRTLANELTREGILSACEGAPNDVAKTDQVRKSCKSQISQAPDQPPSSRTVTRNLLNFKFKEFVISKPLDVFHLLPEPLTTLPPPLHLSFSDMEALCAV